MSGAGRGRPPDAKRLAGQGEALGSQTKAAKPAFTAETDTPQHESDERFSGYRWQVVMIGRNRVEVIGTTETRAEAVAAAAQYPDAVAAFRFARLWRRASPDRFGF